ncbi:MAG: arsenate reductase ArsC [Alphaproteobacteria bacterium]|nr:arsenate reductase ArsC [Alphaproteobacteria bacterium]
MPDSSSEPLNVLFLCTGNSARSIIAEAILNRIGKGEFRAYSAGSQPKGEVNPHTLRLLEALHYPTKDLRSKSWDEFSTPDAPKMDFVFTVCGDAAEEVCPIWPGHPMTAHWGVPDPARVEGKEAVIAEAFDETYRMLNARITAFASLPHASLSRMSLQQHLHDIGKQ